MASWLLRASPPPLGGCLAASMILDAEFYAPGGCNDATGVHFEEDDVSWLTPLPLIDAAVDALQTHELLQPYGCVVQQQEQLQEKQQGEPGAPAPEPWSHTGASAGTPTRSKNIKRYRSVAQRAAHKRYRNRKKANMEAMLAEVSTKRAQLEALTAENERLHTRARVLETSVGCSSHIHDLMQALETLGLADAPSCRADMAGRAAAVTTAATTAAAVAAAPGAPDGAGYPRDVVSHSCCGCSGDGADDAQNRAASAAQAISSAGGGGHQCQAVALAGDSTTAASPAPAIRQQLAGAFSSPEQGLQTYRAFVQDAAALMEARNRGDKAAIEALEDLGSRIVSSAEPLLVAHGQGLVYDLGARRLDTLAPATPPPWLWPAVAEAMALAPRQAADAVTCYEIFGSCLARLLDQRLVLSDTYQQLQSCDDDASGARAAASAAAAASSASAAAALEGPHWRAAAAAELRRVELGTACMEVLRSLAGSLEAYQALDGVFVASLTACFSRAQLAAACVVSYPYLPNWHAIAAHLQASSRQCSSSGGAGRPANRRSSERLLAQVGRVAPGVAAAAAGTTMPLPVLV